MNICGIISEYNPFHKGHYYHIQKTKELLNSDGVIAIMSGNFAQRGIPTIIDKWHRTNMALNCGIDLVIELPGIFSISSAEFFAEGAINILNSMKVVNNISFGSEHGEIDLIKNIAEVLVNEPLEFKETLKIYLKEGLPYTHCRTQALIDYFNIHKKHLNIFNLKDVMNSSNNILAIEYYKSLLKNQSKITPITIKREGGSYNSLELNNIFSSATSIRKFLKNHGNINEIMNHMPDEAFKVLKNLKEIDYPFTYGDKMFPFIKYKLLTNSHSLSLIPEASEGLSNKIIKSLRNSNNLEELILNAKSKRYTYTRISRLLTQFFIGFDNYNINSLRLAPCNYIRVLGLNARGAQILKKIKKLSSLEIITKVPKHPSPMLSLDLHCTRAYSLINPSIAPEEDYLRSPIIIK